MREEEKRKQNVRSELFSFVFSIIGANKCQYISPQVGEEQEDQKRLDVEQYIFNVKMTANST